MYILLFTLVIATVMARPSPEFLPSNYDESVVNAQAQPEDMVQIDMRLTPEQKALLNESDSKSLRKRRAAVGYKAWTWPNGIIPVKFAPAFTAEQVTYIRSQMDLLEKASCITFEILNDGDVRTDYIEVIDGSGCWSYVGYFGGRQTLSLARWGCLGGRVIPHEFLHALGFFHEQGRPDRDDYVEIKWDNIQTGYEHNFNKQSISAVDSKDVPYDLKSIMHYKSKYFTNNGKATIVPKNNYQGIMGGDSLTDSDLLQLNLLYECDSQPTPKPTTTQKPTTTTTTTTQKPTTTTTTQKPTTTTTTQKPTTTTSTTTTTTTTQKPTTTTSTTTTQKPTTTTTTTTQKPTTTTSTTTTQKPTTTTTTTTTQKPTTTTSTTTTTTQKPPTTTTQKPTTTTSTTTTQKPTTTTTTTTQKPTTTTTTTTQKTTTTTTTQKPTTTTQEPTTTTTTQKPTTTTEAPQDCPDEPYWCKKYATSCGTVYWKETICPCFCKTISK